MKRKQRYILGKGFVGWRDGHVGLYTGHLTPVLLNIPTKKFWCYCLGDKCKCKQWKLVLERA